MPNFQCRMAHHEDYLDGRQADQQGFDRQSCPSALTGRSRPSRPS